MVVTSSDARFITSYSLYLRSFGSFYNFSKSSDGPCDWHWRIQSCFKSQSTRFVSLEQVFGLALLERGVRNDKKKHLNLIIYHNERTLRDKNIMCNTYNIFVSFAVLEYVETSSSS